MLLDALFDRAAGPRRGCLRSHANHGELRAVQSHDKSSVFTSNKNIDLVLMDVQMPEMDGLEATAAIRQRERSSGRHTPIVAMTAHALNSDEERCLSAGIDAYISKPIRTNELFATIERLLGMSNQAAAPNDVETRKELTPAQESKF